MAERTAQPTVTQALSPVGKEEPDGTGLAEKMWQWPSEYPKDARINVSKGKDDVDDLTPIVAHEAQSMQSSSHNRPGPSLSRGGTPVQDANLEDLGTLSAREEYPEASTEEKEHLLSVEREAPDLEYPKCPATDSGYASMGRSEDVGIDDDQDGTRTVATDNEELDVPEDVKERLIAAFSGELIKQLQEFLGEANDRITIRHTLAEFLKEYTIRLRMIANAGEQKSATTFVRHYRL